MDGGAGTTTALHALSTANPAEARLAPHVDCTHIAPWAGPLGIPTAAPTWIGTCWRPVHCAPPYGIYSA
eukprot:5868402-Prymnesium_polylepis.1